jgi:hypothetical protein
MMNTTDYLLQIGDIELVLHVDFARSVDSTNAFRGEHGRDYAFVVASVFITHDKQRLLVQDEWDVYNLIVWLGTLSDGLLNPFVIGDARAIVVGKLSDWLHDYWKRVSDDSATVEDKATYELVSQTLLTTDSKNGHIAAYVLDDRTYIEVLSSAGSTRHIQTSTFNSDEGSQNVLETVSKIKFDLSQKFMTLH